MTSDARSRRRSFTRAWGIGSAISTLLYAWMITEGSWNPLRFQRANGNFYDEQARSMLDGNLAISPRVLGFEGFLHDGKTYTYYPPLPAVLRLPVVAVTDSLDGRIGTLSMLVSFVVAVVAAGVLTWRIRKITRGDRALGRFEFLLIALFALMVGIGSPLFFPSSRAWVYHEAAAWGMAFAICAFDQIVAFLDRPTPGRLARASVFGGAAMMSRALVGAGALAALALVLVVVAVAQLRKSEHAARWFAIPDALRRNRRWIVGISTAVVVPALVYAAVNFAKFGTPFNVPYGSQVQNITDTHRQAVLAANGGSMFTVKAIPTQLWQLLRPDGIHIGTTFPFLGFPTHPPTVIGSLEFDQRDAVASLTAATPLLVLLAAFGAVAIWRRGPLTVLRLPVLGALLVVPISWSFLYVAQRFASDGFPLLLLLACAGLMWTLGALDDRPVPWRRAVGVAFVALTAFAAVANFSLALEYQRNLVQMVPDALRRQYVSWQTQVASTLGFGAPPVERGRELPSPRPRDTRFVIGACDGLYVSTGDAWRAVERGNGGGHHRLRARLAGRPAGTVEPLFTAGQGPDRWVVHVKHLGDGRAVLVEPNHGGKGTPFTLDPGQPTDFDVVVDPQVDELRVVRNGREILGLIYAGDATDLTVGADPDEPSTSFSGTIRELPVRTDLCRRVLEQS